MWPESALHVFRDRLSSIVENETPPALIQLVEIFLIECSSDIVDGGKSDEHNE